MANLMDYLDWRGDLSLAQAPFNEVDNLILSELAFIDFDGIVPVPGEGRSVVLWQAAEAFFSRNSRQQVDMGVLVPDAIVDLLHKAAETNRFRGAKLSCFVDRLSVERTEQFAAVTVELEDGTLFLAFRGTDDTLAGWKEDFNMAWMQEVPAQKMAVEYVRTVAKCYPRKKIRLGGHSKGGNLAVWASVFAPASVQRRILHTWSNDGPGFHDEVAESPRFCMMRGRISTIVPKSSVVGLLLRQEKDYVVVDSSQIGLLQHDGFSWKVLGDSFVRLQDVTRGSRKTEQAMKEWLRDTDQIQREKFVEGLFAVLTASGAETLTELKEDRGKSALAMVKAMKDMEKDTRDVLTHAVRLLLKNSMKATVGDLQQGAGKLVKTIGK